MKTMAINTMTIEEIVTELKRISNLLARKYELCAPVAARGMRVPSGAKAIGEQDVCSMVVDDLAITFGIMSGDFAEAVK